MPNYPKKNGYGEENHFVIDNLYQPGHKPDMTGRDTMYNYRNSAQNAGIKASLRRQWLKVDTDSMSETTGATRREIRAVLRAMAKQGEIGFKRVNTDTYIRLISGDIIDIPKQRQKRIKGPVEEIDDVAHYKWCMTCKGTDNLTPSSLTHTAYSPNYQNPERAIRHYVCKDCQKKKKDNATVPFRKWETEHTQRKRYQDRSNKLYEEVKQLKRQLGIPLKNIHKNHQKSLYVIIRIGEKTDESKTKISEINN